MHGPQLKTHPSGAQTANLCSLTTSPLGFVVFRSNRADNSSNGCSTFSEMIHGPHDTPHFTVNCKTNFQKGNCLVKRAMSTCYSSTWSLPVHQPASRCQKRVKRQTFFPPIKAELLQTNKNQGSFLVSDIVI